MLLILAVASLLAGAVIAALVLVMVGIHTDERHRGLGDNPRTRAAAITRRLLNASARGFHDENIHDHDRTGR
jgi:hypothetical protein